MKNETLNLQLSLQRYKGDGLSSVQYEELNELEQQLEMSVEKVRARKVFYIKSFSRIILNKFFSFKLI